MTNRTYIKTFAITSLIGTTLFFVFGDFIFPKLLNYGDWWLVAFPMQFFISFLLMLPLLFPFKYFDKRYLSKGILSNELVTLVKTTLGTIYITAILWFSIFQDQLHRVQIGKSDKANLYDDLKYLGLASLLSILVFAFTVYYFHRQDKTKSQQQ